MKVRLKLLAYLLLAFTLVVIGLPGHASGTSVEHDGFGAMAAANSECPFHQASTTDSTAAPIEIVHDCCGPDCRCACASMSMLVIKRFQSPLTSLPANRPQSANSLLAELYGSRLLRPPQA